MHDIDKQGQSHNLLRKNFYIHKSGKKPISSSVYANQRTCDKRNIKVKFMKSFF